MEQATAFKAKVSLRSVLKPFVDAARDTLTFGPAILFRSMQTRDADGAVSVSTKLGKLSLRPADSDMEALREVFAKKDYDITQFPQIARVKRVYDDLLAKGVTPIIIDAGANIGAASMWFGLKFPKARIYAVEPDPRNARLCRRNCEHVGNVTVIEAAIGSVAGKVNITNTESQSWGVRTERGSDATVPVVTIGDIVAGVPGPAELFMIKVDIEGFEHDLFSTNTDWIADVTVMMVELHDWMLPGQFSSSTFLKAISSYRFEMMNLHSNLILVK